MSKYQIVSAPTNDGLFGINPDWLIKDSETGKYFNGYDFMGSVEWVNIGEAYCMSKDEAEQIVNDLESSEEHKQEETKRECEGYEIIESVRLDSTHEIVIGRSPTALAKFVCWYCNNGDDYYSGAYTMTYRQALSVIAERITKSYDNLPVYYEGI